MNHDFGTGSSFLSALRAEASKAVTDHRGADGAEAPQALAAQSGLLQAESSPLWERKAAVRDVGAKFHPREWSLPKSEEVGKEAGSAETQERPKAVPLKRWKAMPPASLERTGEEMPEPPGFVETLDLRAWRPPDVREIRHPKGTPSDRRSLAHAEGPGATSGSGKNPRRAFQKASDRVGATLATSGRAEARSTTEGSPLETSATGPPTFAQSGPSDSKGGGTT